ncbi:MAG TPA: hypothetical protein VFG83_07035, partial [Kofleriaceae bacterium]|nr:hypothetical protein [Kofleriaceae bacterium]
SNIGDTLSTVTRVEDFIFRYDLAERSVCFRKLGPRIKSDAFPPVTLHKVRSWNFPLLIALPDEIVVRLEYGFFSGHMETYEHGDVILRAPADQPEAIADFFDPPHIDSLRRLYAHPEGWRITDRNQWLARAFRLFEAKTGAGEPGANQYFELDSSVRVGWTARRFRTLRLHRDHDEIIKKHIVFNPLETTETTERLEPPATPQARAAIADCFGAQVAEISAWFHSR